MKLLALERDLTHTLLGIRFWDKLTGKTVAEGLQAKAQRLSDDLLQRVGKPVFGQITPNGTIAFRGLSIAEKPAADSPDLWPEPIADLMPNQLVAVDVVDQKSRFIPLSFVARLPFRGAFVGEGDWLGTALHRPTQPDGDAPGIQLWSAPARTLPPGRAVIRAQLVEGLSNRPAAFALVRSQLRTQPSPQSRLPPFDHYGLTDSQGQLLLPMPYPAIPEPDNAADPYPPLDQQQFELTISVQYAPNQPRLPGSSTPNLDTLLTQPTAQIGTRVLASTPPELSAQNSLPVTLKFDTPLILRTSETPDQSVLRIQPI